MRYAESLTQLGKPAEGRKLLESVLEERQRLYGKGHPKYASVLQSLGFANSKLRRYDEAESQFREADSIFRTTLGEKHPARVECLCYLVEVLADRGQWGEVEKLGRRTISLAAEHVSGNPVLYCRAKIQMARVLYRTGAPEESLNDFQQIADTLESRRSQVHAGFLEDLYIYYLEVLDDAGRDADAERVRKRIAELRRQQEREASDEE